MTKHQGRRRPAGRTKNLDAFIRITRFDNGRMLALYALQQHDVTGRFLREIIAEVDSRHDLSRQERGLAVDVTSGVLRRRRTIDLLLQSQIQRPRADVEPDLWRLLQMGTMQLAFGRTPDHASVDTSVELTRSVQRPQWAGFVNGVLRNIARLMTDETVSQPARNTVPLEDGTWRRLSLDVLSCPLTEPAEFFGEAFSLPRGIARRWHARMTPGDLFAAGFHSLRSPRISLRINPLRSTAAGVTEDFAAASVATEPGTLPECIRLLSSGRVDRLPGYSEGYWSVQDESAMSAGRLVNPQPGETILDLCAAPGGKSTHLAELSNDQATIFACDVSDEKLARIHDNAARLRLSSIHPVLIDRNGDRIPDGPFDAVLIDVPCSNTGVFARRPEARWRFHQTDLAELVERQTRLLMTAFDRVRPGGRVVYSTCSIEPEETGQLIESVVKSVPAMTLEHQQLHLPGQPADGAYVALLRRASEAKAAAS